MSSLQVEIFLIFYWLKLVNVYNICCEISNKINKKTKKMKRLVIMISCLFAAIVATAQEPHTVEFTVTDIVNSYHNELTFCDFDSITGVIVHKAPDFNGTVFWIDEQNSVLQADSIIIRPENDGHLLYIEKENDILLGVDIWILQNEMPAPHAHSIWLSEGGNQTLYPTPEDEGYLYVWESDQWPADSIFQGYELTVEKPGYYKCNMFDQCLHYSMVEYTAQQDPWVRYVTTNIETNTNEICWTPYENCIYDTIQIYRNDTLVGECHFQDSTWTDPDQNNSETSQQYRIEAIYHGASMAGPSKWKSGISLQMTINEEFIDLSFSGPTDEDGTPIENVIQFYQLYSVESTGWGLIQSMIPVTTSELLIENDYDTLVIAGVLFDGHELYSNMIFPHSGTTKCNENNIGKFQIFPNPAKDELFVPVEDTEYRIFNIQGQMVQNGRSTGRIDISNLNSGVHIIEIREKDSTTTIKFVVE